MQYHCVVNFSRAKQISLAKRGLNNTTMHRIKFEGFSVADGLVILRSDNNESLFDKSSVRNVVGGLSFSNHHSLSSLLLIIFKREGPLGSLASSSNQ